MNIKSNVLTIQDSVREIYLTKSRLKSEYDEFIHQAMAIARKIDEKEKLEVPCHRQVRNCISKSMPLLLEAKTSVSDIGKYEVLDPPLYYNLNLYMLISYAILVIYNDIKDQELKSEIKTLLLNCLEGLKLKTQDMLAAVSDKELIYDEELKEHFTVYLESLNKIIHLIMEEKLSSSANNDIFIYIERLRERRTYIYERTVYLTDTDYMNNIQTRVNSFYEEWQKSQKAEDAKYFLEEASSIANSISQLTGIIVSVLGGEDVAKAWEGAAVILGATLTVGASIIMAVVTGPIGIIGIGAAILGGITSIVSYFVGLGQKSPEEIILEQIEKLGNMIHRNFKALFDYLHQLERTIVENFMDIRLDIKNLEEKVSTIQTTLDTIFDILLDAEYFNLRNEVLTYHNNFESDMSENLQISGFYNFVNCAMIKAKDKSKHINQGIDYCLEGIAQEGIDRYISFLAEYADQYICRINKVTGYISPMYWGEGCLSLIEFILRTPEFKLLEKQKKTFSQMISLGESVNELAMECYRKEIIKKVIIKYQYCLQSLTDKFKWLRMESLKDKDMTEYINDLFNLYEDVSKDPLLKSIDEYMVLIRAYTYLILRFEVINNAHLERLLKSLWGKKDFLNYFNAECGKLNRYKYEIKSDYDNLIKTKGADAIEEITIFINDKYGPFKRIYNVIVELNRICRVLTNYSEKKRELDTDYPLINRVRDYMKSFNVEFFAEESKNRIPEPPFGIEHFNYFCVDFGNTIHFNSLAHFDSKHEMVVGDISLPNTTVIKPWEVLDGNWHIDVKEGKKQVEFLFKIDNDKIHFPIYLNLASQFLNMDDEGYFDRKVQLTITNSLGSYDIVSDYRPELYNGVFSNMLQLSLFNGKFLRTPKKAMVFPGYTWNIPRDKISVGENRLVLSTNSSLMVQRLEIGSDLRNWEPEPIVYFCEKKLNKYLGIEKMNLDGNTGHRIILKNDLDETCYFKFTKMQFTENFLLYSDYLNDYMVPTPFQERNLWINSFDLRPLQELLNSCKEEVKPLVERNIWLKLVESKDIYTLVLPIFAEQYTNDYGYICIQDINKSDKQFFAGTLTHSSPLWFDISEKK